MAKKKSSIFTSVMFPKVGSNRFDLSHDVKMSFQMGWLTPTCVMDVVPGDKFSINVENMLRFSPLIAPVMHQVRVTTHFYFVPNRILWPDWERWITGDLDVEAPYFNTNGALTEGSLGDYLGIPPGISGINISALPVAAYAKIYDDYYRDQNLQEEVFTPLVAGNNTGEAFDPYALALAAPLNRAWMHDYFTSALPFAQKGDVVTIPLTIQEDIPVDYTNNGNPVTPIDPTTGSPIVAAGGVNVSTGPVPFASSLTRNAVPFALDPNDTLTVDVQSDAADINTLRRAFRLQEWLERNARGGTRYIENILAHFGVRSSDSRLQRPEYLGGASQNMVISEVLSTAQTIDGEDATTTPVGYMAGHGISAGRGNRFSYSAEEHGWIVGIINVQPTTAYQQGVPRAFTREDKLDYYWPSFANIGEQEIKLKELWTGTVVDPAEYEETFGYIPRYSEYKYMNNRVAGEMRDSLSFWHMGRIFDPETKPVLDETFITSSPTDRIFAVTDSAVHKIYAHIFNRVSAVRKMPMYGVPTI